MSAIFPSAVATPLQLLTAINNTKVTLNVDAGIGDTTLTVDDASPLPSAGYVTFDDNEGDPETVQYTGISGNNLTGVTRGADGTSAGTHVIGSNLEMRWNAAYHNIVTTELIAVEQNLSDRFGTDSGTHVVKIVDGMVGTPALTFAADLDSGLYRIGNNDIALATNGTKALEINATQQVVVPNQVLVSKTTNQFILGTTNTTTISAVAPVSSVTYTIPDAGSNATFIMSVGTASLSLSTALTVTGTTNQLILGTTHTTTISSVAPSASRIYTIPDAGATANFVMTQGAQTISGATTIAALTATLAANLAAGGFKVTGLANGTATTDAMAFGQLKVIQVKSGSFNGRDSTTNNSAFQNSSLNVSITPTSASNSVLVFLFSTAEGSASNSGPQLTIARGSTSLGGTGGLSILDMGTASASTVPMAMGIMDTPATTSATTYTLQFKVATSGGGTANVGTANAVATIIAIEVAP